MQKQEGFTIIEMLVVVAAIGILSSVLLTSLEPARKKAKDSRIIQEVNQVRSLAETFYDGDYDALDVLPSADVRNPDLKVLAEDIRKQGGELVIRRTSSGYIAYTKLNTLVGVSPDLRVNYYCVDSTGRSGYTTSDLAARGLLQCPL